MTLGDYTPNFLFRKQQAAFFLLLGNTDMLWNVVEVMSDKHFKIDMISLQRQP